MGQVLEHVDGPSLAEWSAAIQGDAESSPQSNKVWVETEWSPKTERKQEKLSNIEHILLRIWLFIFAIFQTTSHQPFHLDLAKADKVRRGVTCFPNVFHLFSDQLKGLDFKCLWEFAVLYILPNLVNASFSPCTSDIWTAREQWPLVLVKAGIARECKILVYRCKSSVGLAMFSRKFRSLDYFPSNEIEPIFHVFRPAFKPVGRGQYYWRTLPFSKNEFCTLMEQQLIINPKVIYCKTNNAWNTQQVRHFQWRNMLIWHQNQ